MLTPVADPTTFHLVRHAAHALLPHTLAGRMAGVGLSDEGRAQARTLARHLAGRSVAAVVSSPVQRALETAAPVAAALGLPVGIDAGFEEIDFGTWTGRRFDDLAADPAWDAWNCLRSLARCPSGETMHEAQSRALAALGRLRAAHAGQEVVVVSHADVVKAMLAPALGLPLDLLHRLLISPASCSTLVVFDADVQVASVNGLV